MNLMISAVYIHEDAYQFVLHLVLRTSTPYTSDTEVTV